RPVEVDRIHVAERHETLDLDRARGVVTLDRLQVRVLDDDELTLSDLPPLDDLLGGHLALVHGTPAAVLDRRMTFAVQLPECDVGGTSRRLRRGREADGDRDQAEADRSVPGRTHGATWILGAPPNPFEAAS